MFDGPVCHLFVNVPESDFTANVAIEIPCNACNVNIEKLAGSPDLPLESLEQGVKIEERVNRLSMWTRSRDKTRPVPIAPRSEDDPVRAIFRRIPRIAESAHGAWCRASRGFKRGRTVSRADRPVSAATVMRSLHVGIRVTAPGGPNDQS